MVLNDFFLNPNLAYLLLVAGVMLGVMALLTPGTGFFEIGALFALALAGWQVYHLPVNAWALGVLALGVALFLLAVRRSGNLAFLGMAILAMWVGSSFLFRGEGWLPAVSPVLAVIVSALSGGFLWLITVKTLEVEKIAPVHDLSTLVGSVGITRTAVHTEGTVLAAGEEWSAQSHTPLPAGANVRVTGREGFLLWVEPLEPQPADNETGA